MKKFILLLLITSVAYANPQRYFVDIKFKKFNDDYNEVMIKNKTGLTVYCKYHVNGVYLKEDNKIIIDDIPVGVTKRYFMYIKYDHTTLSVTCSHFQRDINGKRER